MARKLKWVLFIVLVVVVCLNLKSILKIFYPIDYSSSVERYTAQYKLERHMVYAIIRIESKFVPDARSGKGAIGLMQITTQTGKYLAGLMHDKDYDEKHLYDPDTNIKYGCFYLSKLLKDFDGDMICALAAYNGGEGNVRKWAPIDKKGNRTLEIEKIPFLETRNYVKKVNKYYKLYKFLYTDQKLNDFIGF